MKAKMQDVRVRFEIRNMDTNKEITLEFRTGADTGKEKFDEWAHTLLELFSLAFSGKFKEAQKTWHHLDKLEE